MLKAKYLLVAALIISFAGNVYLFNSVITWQKAWLAQVLATSDVEKIFRSSGADISFNAIQSIAKQQYTNSFKVLSQKEVVNESLGPYDNILLVGETKLYFRENAFVGSKANLPSNANCCWLSNEF